MKKHDHDDDEETYSIFLGTNESQTGTCTW